TYGPTTIPSAPAEWDRTPATVPLSTVAAVFTASTACWWSTPRSCRRSRRRTPTYPRSWWPRASLTCWPIHDPIGGQRSVGRSRPCAVVLHSAGEQVDGRGDAPGPFGGVALGRVDPAQVPAAVELGQTVEELAGPGVGRQ